MRHFSGMSVSRKMEAALDVLALRPLAELPRSWPESKISTLKLTNFEIAVKDSIDIVVHLLESDFLTTKILR